MSLGRISGPLLKANLLRQEADIAIETNLLYLKVNTNAADVIAHPLDANLWTGKVGIKTTTPVYDLDVNGTTRSPNIISTQVDIGNLTITNNTLSTDIGNITLTASTTGFIITSSPVQINNTLEVSGTATFNGNTVIGDIDSDFVNVKGSFNSDLLPLTDTLYNLGSSSKKWNELFIDKLQVNGITNTGERYGTAPIVTHILYVTVDGSDTNDGTAQDSTKACRTITGALRSPAYREGTSIKVAPGHYLEDNPLLLRPYTSIIGSDLRTTTVEPINKTQDLFHMNSSCYIAQMQFLNGRSGIIDPNIDRGAYSIAFPRNDIKYGSSIDTSSNNTTVSINAGTIPQPQKGWIATINSIQYTLIDQAIRVGNAWILPFNTVIGVTESNPVTLTPNKLDLYKSPYVQNCTNQSGPWLYDGTMFVPNQTVQIPIVVGTTTFTDSETVIDVTVSEGTIIAGMSINTAPQDQGFFSARTLMLANKLFVQEQVLLYIQHNIDIATIGSIWYEFTYQQEKCRRDVGIIVENVLYDTTFGGNSKSIESGLAYFRGNVSIIPGEESQSVAAIGFIKTLVSDIVNNLPVTGYSGGVYSQTINSNLTGGNIAVEPILNNLTIITNILTRGVITSGTGDGSFVTVLYTGPTFENGDKITISGVSPEGFNGTFVAISAGVGTVTFANTTIGSMLLVGEQGTISLAIPDIHYSTGAEFGLVSAEILMQANRIFIQHEVTAWVDYQIANSNGTGIWNEFVYNSTYCFRDVGLIIDAISQDILLGGNSKTVEAASSYYSANQLVIQGEVDQTLAAFEYAKDIVKDIVQNTSIVKTFGNPESQIVNTYFSRGGISTDSIDRNFTILENIIQNGKGATPIIYSGSGLFSATGVSSDDVKQSTKVAEIVSNVGNVFTIRLSQPTVGIGNNSTLYFGYPSVYPQLEANIPDRWNQRRVDPWGSVGGMIVDGGVISDISPIQSFVMDAYTQVNQGGRGIRVTNNGYAQLVSVFTIFCSIAVQVDNGGICSITNSNSNFGEYCLVAKGYGKREFTGTIYNPAVPLYPNGVYPKKGTVAVFIPDTAYRPHIALVMEVEPKETYRNAQGTPGFLSASVSLATITKGSLTITDIDVTNISIGQVVYIRDQYGNYSDPISGIPFVLPNTTVTDVSYQTITLNQPINLTAGDINNPIYFTMFTAGNAYYTIISSVIADPLYLPVGSLILPNNDPITGQLNAELDSLILLNNMIQSVVSNTLITELYQEDVTQVLIPSLSGTDSQAKIASSFTIIENIFTNPAYITGNINSTLLSVTNVSSGTIAIGNIIIGDGIIDGTRIVSFISGSGSIGTYEISNSQTINSTSITCVNVPEITKTGPVAQSDGDATKLIEANIDFFVAEIHAFITASKGTDFVYNVDKCLRDVALVCRRVSEDLLAGGNYNSVYSGLSYYSRQGTYHILTLEENLNDNSLVPDGAFINFYQRSYMSASGYLFEYVGSGSNYGALPQVGRVDPIQSREVVMLDSGKVFFTSTDQNGDFRIGSGLVISQATGVLSGRTFQKSLFAEMTPFILALE